MPIPSRPQPRKRPRLKMEEEGDQARVVRELRRLKLLFNAQSNGLPLGAKASITAVATGLEAGCPDLLIFSPPPLAPDARGVALEMKRLKAKPKTTRAGKWSGAKPHQRAYLDALEALGWVCLIGYGAQDALEKLKALGYAVRPIDGERWRAPTGATGSVEPPPEPSI